MRERKSFGEVVAVLAAWAVVIFVAVSLPGCKSTEYIPVESVRTEYRDREVERLVADTVHDTRLVWVKGDTVVDIRDRWHRSTEIIHDTCYVEHTDSVAVPYPVEKRLSRWQQAKMDFGGMAMGVLAAVLCIAVVWLIKKFRK